MRFSYMAAAVMTMLLGASPSHSFVYGPTDTGRAILESAGMSSGNDIDSALFDFGDVCYRLTSKRNSDLLGRFYERLRCTLEDRPDAGLPAGRGARVTITRADGRVVQMMFGRDPVEGHDDKVQLAQGYWVPNMAPVLDEIRKDAEAAALDSRLPSSEVANLEVRVPDLGTRDVPTSLPEGEAVVAKARDILDWLDLRNARAQELSEGEFTTAKNKFTTITLTIKTPIPLNAFVVDSTKLPFYKSYPIGRDLKATHFVCDTLMVMDYGNYKPPVIVARDPDHVYYLFTDLRRRAEEKAGVEKFGFPGHPVSDKDYYKSPQELYKELQSLAKAAYEAVAKEK